MHRLEQIILSKRIAIRNQPETHSERAEPLSNGDSLRKDLKSEVRANYDVE